jgi:hypothetical protein
MAADVGQMSMQAAEGGGRTSEADTRTDCRDLFAVQTVGGVEELERQMQAQGVALQQVAEWLHAMQASSTAITAHLAEVRLKLDHVVQRVDNVDSTLQQILACLNRTAAEQQKQEEPMPVVVIPRSEIHYTNADKQVSPSGAFGTVVRATRDEGYVAVKIYTHRGLGDRDRKRVVQEALLLASANHPNIVRCYGIVHDPVNPNSPDNIQGSLVMEWVHGGDLYTWLQKYDDTSMYDRLKLAAQVRLAQNAAPCARMRTATFCSKQPLHTFKVAIDCLCCVRKLQHKPAASADCCAAGGSGHEVPARAPPGAR